MLKLLERVIGLESFSRVLAEASLEVLCLWKVPSVVHWKLKHQGK